MPLFLFFFSLLKPHTSWEIRASSRWCEYKVTFGILKFFNSCVMHGFSLWRAFNTIKTLKAVIIAIMCNVEKAFNLKKN